MDLCKPIDLMPDTSCGQGGATIGDYIAAFKKAYPKPLEKYEHKVILTAEKAREVIIKSEDENAMKMLDKIEDGKSYTFTKSDYRPVNVTRRIKQFWKEKRPDKYIFDWLIALENVQKELLMNQIKLNGNGDQPVLPAPEGVGS